MTVELSWKPIRNGAEYCSPACGGGRTHAAYMRAQREAAALCKQFPGFKPRVWENVGWHWGIVNNGVFIHPCTPHHFHAGIIPGVLATGRTARSALRNMEKYLKRKVTEHTARLSQVKAAMLAGK